MRVQTWADFSLAVKAGATAGGGGGGRLAGTVTSKQERKTRTGNKMGIVAFSDSSGQYEAVLFFPKAWRSTGNCWNRASRLSSRSMPRRGRRASG